MVLQYAALMHSLWNHAFQRNTLLLLLSLGLIGGVGLAHFGFTVGGLWCLSMCVIGLLLTPKRSLGTLLCYVLCGLIIGCWRGGIFIQKLEVYNQYYYQKVTLNVVALDDGVYGNKSQLAFTGGYITLPDGRPLAGKLTVSGFGMSAVFQGDKVRIVGKLYPTLGSAQGRMSFAGLQLVAHHTTAVSEVRRKFTAGMQTALPEPLSSFAMGLLVGQRATLPADVKQDLLMVGLTHIIAVSGYNLTIMLRASKKVLNGRSKRLATMLSFGLIAVFLLVAGASASIVRAAIVSSLSIVAGYYGRSFQPLTLVTLAAAITAYAKPFYVWTDVSWYLSFLAFYGVMVLAPLIATRLPARVRDSLVGMLALESLCAEAVTLPIVLHTFGQMSFVGLIANVLVAVMVPIAMLLSLVAGLAGMLIGPIAGWFAWPAALVLSYMLDVARLLARMPHAFVQHVSLSLLQMLNLYLIVAAVTAGLWFKSRLKSATITDKKLVEQ